MPNKLEGMSEAGRLQLLVDSVTDYAIYMIGPEGHVLSWNSGAHRLKGYTQAEIVGETFTKFYSPEDVAAGVPQNALQIARETGRYWGEGWRYRKDGSKFWALVVIDAIKDDNGELLGFAKVTRDMTERQEAHQKLLASERQYRLLIEAVIDYAIFQLDREGNVTTWNPGAQHIKGYAPDEIIGKHFSCFYTEEDRAAGLPQKVLAQAAAGRFEGEGRRVRKDGGIFWASVVIDPIRDERGNLIGFAKVTRDITDRKEAEERLKAAQAQLAASQKLEAVGQLSGGIAHDFNNLLMIVLGNLETLQRQLRDLNASDHAQRSLALAMRGAHRAAALTSRLLAFSRRQPLDPKPVNVNSFLTNVRDFLQRSLGEQVELETVGSAGLWQIESDPNHLESAIVNLAINARDAMPEGGKLTLEAANVWVDDEYSRANPELAPGQYVSVSVTDTGTGMTPDTQSHAFEPFFTTKEVGRGTGLGLSQVYGFVKQSGGHVKIYSELGQGTTIKLYFPRYMGKDTGDENAIEKSVTGTDFHETLLIVEDDPDLRTYLGDVLRGLRYRILTAPNATAALALLQQEGDIDLLLTDIVMPGINGRELADKAKLLRPDMLVLYMTGYSRNAVIHQGRLDEGVSLIQKPVSQAELAHRIRLMLDKNGQKK